MAEFVDDRGQSAWFMAVVDVRLGHAALGFDYPMSGDFLTRWRTR